MEKAVPGQRRIPAKDWNEIRDFLNRYAPKLGGMVNNPLNPFFVYVQNDTSDDLPAFSIVKLDGAIYPNRSTDDTKDAALNQLLEISGDTPTGEAGENIGILQEDVPAGQLGKAIVSGASLCYIQVASANTLYRYAKSMDATGQLKADTSHGQTKIVWKQSGAGRKLAYVVLDDTDDRERFLIKASSNPNPSDYEKGNLEYIIWSESNKAWIPGDYDDDSSRLVVCQEDMPTTLSIDFWMPYFPLEDNIGVEANVSTGTGEAFSERCGVYPGEHVISNKRLDYHYANGRYTYEPRFIYIGEAKGGSGSSGVAIEIEGEEYDVTFPSVRSTTSFPDVYSYDQITVEVDARDDEPEITAVDYPMDFPENTIISSYSNLTSSPYRGWEDVTDTKYRYDIGYSDLLVLKKKSGGTQIADLRTHQCTCNNGGSSGSSGEGGGGGGGHSCPHDEVTTSEATFRWYKKIKTDALI